MAKIYPKWPKKCQKWSEIFRKMIQIRPVTPTLNCPTEDGEKLPKITKKQSNDPKMAQNGLFFI